MAIEVTAALLHKEGKLLKHDEDWNAFLYAFNGLNFVILSDNSIVTQEEDNMFGPDDAIFPIQNN
jgi:hypothetical protein